MNQPPKQKKKRVDPYDIVLEALLEFSKRSINRRSGAMPISSISVVEFMDRDGKFWSAIISDPKLPPWRKVGLLYHAIDEVSQEQIVEEDDEDET